MSCSVNYVTYFDYSFIDYGSVATISFLRTHKFDRLTLVTDSRNIDPAQAAVLRSSVEALMGLDSRVRTVDVGEIIRDCADPGTTYLLESAESSASPIHVFADALRAYLYPWFGGPVVWFDSDVIFTGDTSGVFEDCGEEPCAAAPDTISMIGDRRGQQVYKRFVDYVNVRRPGAMRGSEARNIGFILLRRDIRPIFREGLGLALNFIKIESDPLVYYFVGQLAWNYVFDRVGGRTLPSKYNVPAQCLPERPTSDDLHDESVLVRHYIGAEYKKMIIPDFGRIFAWPEDRLTSAVLCDPR